MKVDLVRGVDIFTTFELFQKTAACKGLKLEESTSSDYSKPIKVYTLDDKLLTVLAKRGIKQRHHHPDSTNLFVNFTLLDENPQKGDSPSVCWGFKQLEGDKGDFDLRIFLKVAFGLSFERREIILLPLACSTSLYPMDELPHFRMFKALVESDNEPPFIAKELAESNGSIVVSGNELGLGDICSLASLFIEFANRNDAIIELNNNNPKVFDLEFFPQWQRLKDDLFVTEFAQPRVIQRWRLQLSGYRNSFIA